MLCTGTNLQSLYIRGKILFTPPTLRGWRNTKLRPAQSGAYRSIHFRYTCIGSSENGELFFENSRYNYMCINLYSTMVLYIFIYIYMYECLWYNDCLLINGHGLLRITLTLFVGSLSPASARAVWPWAFRHSDSLQQTGGPSLFRSQGQEAYSVVLWEWRATGHLWWTQWCCVVYWRQPYPLGQIVL